LCANKGSASTSDSQKIINSGWLFIVGGFAQEARSCFDLAFFFLRIAMVAWGFVFSANGVAFNFEPWATP